MPTSTVEPRSWRAALLAVIASIAAAALRVAAGLIFPDASPFATFYLATFLVTILAGRAAGIACSIIGYFLGALVVTRGAWFSVSAAAFYTLISAAFIWLSGQYRRLLREVQQREQLAARQAQIIAQEKEALTRVVEGRPIAEVMELLTHIIEDFSDGLMASVLFLEGDKMRHVAAPSLPDSYNRAIDGIAAGPSVGSCGTAAYRKEPVIVENIDEDPLWDDFRELAQEHGLKACWSTPIMSRSGEVLGTFAVYHREPHSPRPDEIALVQLLVNTATVAIEHDQASAQREILVHELAHRMRNLLTIVQSLASGTLRPHIDPENFGEFENRLAALGKAQQALTRSEGATGDLCELIEDVVLAPFGPRRKRVQVEGPPAQIDADLALTFALCLHELCTNAAKYGALSNDTGRVEIEWGSNPDGRFRFRWTERGGPPVEAPRRAGFGTRMISRVLKGAADSEPRMEFAPEGFKCEFMLAASRVSIGREPAAAAR